eukprot:TRINITY_DN2266_c0_g2_i1.p1 TRINITY_DN2266_c0_g2~~TRINITY_DN2266_c0_g2_i1.p1  ORF type:complete len:1612 (-),score=266.31 TRINITY_DN2266_c0_g2_i1:35-4837(-)
MSSTVGPSLMYTVLAICLVMLMTMQDHSQAAELYSAAVSRFENSPWQLNPTKTVRQVKGGPQVYAWLTNVFVNQLYVEAENEYLGAGPHQNESLMVASFNKVLAGRLTLKRRFLNKPTDAVMANAIARGMAYQKTDSRSFKAGEELTTAFGATQKFTYEKNKGYNNAGGYVHMLDFTLSKNDILQQLAGLRENFWFDLSQGSFAVELLYFNGNVERFLYVAYTFEHDFSGLTEVRLQVSPLDMTIHDFSEFDAWVRALIYLIILSFYSVFFKNEVDDMSADYRAYFSQPMGFINVSSFVAMLYTMILYLTLVVDFTFLNFRLPMNQDPQKKIEQFQALAHAAGINDSFHSAISITTGIVVLQAVLLLTSLLSQWRLIVRSISSMGRHLEAYFVIFFIMLIGFALAGHGIFGLELDQFGSFTRSLVTVMEMAKGKDIYKDILAAGGPIGDGYWFCLEFCFLIFQQLLTAVIIVGYFMQRQIQSEMDESAQPLQRFMKSVKVTVLRLITNIRRVFVPVTQLLAGLFRSSSPPREDFDFVARLRDKRPTKPAKRTVVYEQMDDKEPIVISDDVSLRVEKAFYPDGMMHYYVERTAREGPAADFRIQKGFRLIGIKKEGAWDRKKFRDPASFQGDPQAVLKELTQMPVQLEFQGGVRLLSLECVVFLLFWGVFLAFGLHVARVEDAFSLVSIQKKTIAGDQWVDEKLARVMSFDNISMDTSLSQWMQGVFFKHHMACSTALGSSVCRDSTAASAARRDWALWVTNSEQDNYDLSNFTSPVDAERAGIRLFNGKRPASALGMSIGFVPDGLPNLTANESGVQDSTVNTSMSQRDGKVLGVMRNNYARLTFQTACFQGNKAERFKEGYPYVIDPVILRHQTCSSAPCMKDMINSESACLSLGGVNRDKRQIYGANSSLLYRYSDEGTYMQHGGIAIGFGLNLAEANFVWERVARDLPTDVVSAALEFVDYNGNLDMFTYTKVSVDMKPTGEIARDVSTVVFPMNIFSMGHQEYSNARTTANWALFFCYFFAAFLFTLFLLRDIWIQLSLTRLSKPWYMFISDFFIDDYFNTLDVVCLVLNIYTLESLLRYMLLDGGLDLKRGFRSWTLDYEALLTINPEVQDPFQEFSRVAQIYKTFTELVALNSFFVSIRVLKYFRNLTALRLVLKSVVDAICEFLLLAMLIVVVVTAFVFMFYMRYGVLVRRYRTVVDASQEIFLFLVGTFVTDDLFDIDAAFLTFAFFVFQVVFSLILNVLVAAITYRWRDSRRDAEHFSIASAVHTIKDSVKVIRSTKNAGNADSAKDKMQKLDENFWQQLSVLRHVAGLDESGKIFPSTSPGGGDLRKKLRETEDRKESAEEEEVSDDENEKDRGAFNFNKEEDRKRFIKVFMKAHMEIASQMSRSVVTSYVGKDRGAGVALEEVFVDEMMKEGPKPLEEVLEEELYAEEEAKTIGILEEPQPLEIANSISRQMQQLLEASERPAREIWLDALLTVLEEAGALKVLQKVFLPMPMIHPKKTQDWYAFYQKKEKMERRLNGFFFLLVQEAEVMHYRYLKEMAVSKERVLKQQSLVLTDYLVSLDTQIAQLHAEIISLEKRNTSIQTHVSPLL